MLKMRIALQMNTKGDDLNDFEWGIQTGGELLLSQMK